MIGGIEPKAARPCFAPRRSGAREWLSALAFLLVALTLAIGVSVPAAAQTVTFAYTGTKTTWVAPFSGDYRVVAIGAQGGQGAASNGGQGGRGAQIAGTFNFSAGQQLQIAVGGSGGGGGGSFLVDAANTPLLIAGGGGGGGGGGFGVAGLDGGSSSVIGGDGLGGNVNHGGGGGGFFGNGGSSPGSTGGGGGSWGSGLGGGGGGFFGNGGFGGGGGAHIGGGSGFGGGGGGGGGYSGGDGGHGSGTASGGGGGGMGGTSYYAGADLFFTPGVGTGNGSLTITFLGAPTDATLSNLVLSDGTLDPAFSPAETGYTATVPNAIDSITVTPTASDTNATISANGAAVTSGDASGAINLNVGANPIAVVVTAADGSTTQTYTVTVIREAPAAADATLSALTLSAGTLNPAFAAGTTGYTATVPNATASIALAPTASDAAATITVNGAAVLSGNASAAIALNVGANPITTIVIAEDGTTTQTYTVTVIREAPVELVLSPAAGALPDGEVGTAYAQTFTAAGGSGNYSYAVTVGALPTGLALSADGALSGAPAAAQSAGFTITATDVDIPANTGSAAYTLEIAPPPVSADATLSALVLSVGVLDPTFAPGQTAYAASVPHESASITVTPTASDAAATITVNGATVASGNVSGPIDLNAGQNTIAVVVVAEGGATTRTYTVAVNRERPDPSLDPEVIGLVNAQANTAMRFARNQMRNFHDRLERLHDENGQRGSGMEVRFGYSGSAAANTAIGLIDQLIANSHAAVAGSHPGAAPGVLAYDGAATGAPAGQYSPYGGPDLGPFAIWSGGFVNFGERDNGGLDLGYTMVGVSGGVDYRFSEQFIGGFGVGYGRDRSDIGSNGTKSTANAFSAAVYGSYKPIDNLFIDGLFGGSRLDFDSRRFVTADGDFATGSRSGSQIFGSLTAAYEFRDESWLVSPYGRVEFSRSWLDGFTETGGGIHGLTYGDQTVDTLSTVLGIRASYAFQMDRGVLTPGIRAEYTHDFAGSSRASLGYTDPGGLPYSIEVDPTLRDFVTLGVSLDMQFRNDWNLGFDYGTGFGGEGDQDHTIRARLGVQF